MKGETIEEITACAKVLREKCTHIDPGKDVLDIVGTGGDCANTFNISTTSSFVIAAAGVPEQNTVIAAFPAKAELQMFWKNWV